MNIERADGPGHGAGPRRTNRSNQPAQAHSLPYIPYQTAARRLRQLCYQPQARRQVDYTFEDRLLATRG